MKKAKMETRTIPQNEKRECKLQAPAAIYARQSIDKKDSLSIESQIDSCTAYLNSSGYSGIVYVYSDKGFSGKNTDRPEFKKLYSDIEDGKIKTLMIYKLDRISRNLLDFIQMYSVFEKKEVEFCSVENKFDTSTPTGRMMLNISMAFAELERANIQARVKDNYYDRIKHDGRWCGGPAPFGFDNAKNDKNVSTLKPNDNIEIVKRAYNIYGNDANISLGKLAKILNDEGFVGKSGKPFDNVTIGRILRNPVYASADEKMYSFFKSKGYKLLNEDKEDWIGEYSAQIVHKRDANDMRKWTDKKEQSVYLTNIKGTIDSKLFIEVQDRLSNNKQIGRANSSSALEELAGILKCKKCGCAVKMYNKGVLSCYGQVSKRGRDLNDESKVCDAKFASGKKSARQVITLHSIQTQVGAQIILYYIRLRKYCEELAEEDKSVEMEIEKLEKRINNMLDMAIDTEDKKFRKKLQEKAEQANREKSKLELELQMNDATKRLSEIKSEIKYFDLTIDEKKQIVNKLINKVYLSTDGTIEIEWKKTVDAEYGLMYNKDGSISINEKQIKPNEWIDLICQAVNIQREIYRRERNFNYKFKNGESFYPSFSSIDSPEKKIETFEAEKQDYYMSDEHIEQLKDFFCFFRKYKKKKYKKITPIRNSVDRRKKQKDTIQQLQQTEGAIDQLEIMKKMFEANPDRLILTLEGSSAEDIRKKISLAKKSIDKLHIQLLEYCVLDNSTPDLMLNEMLELAQAYFVTASQILTFRYKFDDIKIM